MKLRGGPRRGLRLPWSWPEREELRGWLLVLGLVLGAFGGGYLLASQVLFPPASEAGDAPLVEVPSVRGESLEEARNRLADHDLRAEVAYRPTTPDADSGTVLGQRPLPGQMARSGATIQLTVSRGSEEVRVPGLQGLPEERARSVLRSLGLEATSRGEPSAMRKGEVVGTEPPAGTEVTVPARVRLVVSEGPEVGRVPELVGRHVDDIPGLLEEAGLELGSVEFDPDAANAPGRVVGQSPPPGFSLRRGGSVSVRVAGSRGDWSPPERDTTDVPGSGS